MFALRTLHRGYNCPWTTVTRCSLESLTAFCGILRLCKTLQHALLLMLDRVSTSRPFEATSLAVNALLNMVIFNKAPLNGQSPQYLADDCQLATTTGRRRLRSSNVATSEVPRTLTNLSNRSFMLLDRVSGTTYLPTSVILNLSFLKTPLFCCDCCLVTVVLRALCKIGILLHYTATLYV